MRLARRGSAVLSRSSEYAVRALAYLGTRKGRPFMLGREIADDLGMPPPFLSKVLQILTAAGILQSKRGRGGGFRLRRDPGSVTIFEIIEPFDHLGDRKSCLLGRKHCGDNDACPLHYAWTKTRNALLAALRKTTLADVEKSAGKGGFRWIARTGRSTRARPAPRPRRGTGSRRRLAL